MEYTGKSIDLDLTKENSTNSKRYKKGHNKKQSYDQDDDFDIAGKSSNSLQGSDNDYNGNEGKSIFDTKDISTIKKKDKKQKNKPKRDSYDY